MRDIDILTSSRCESLIAEPVLTEVLDAIQGAQRSVLIFFYQQPIQKLLTALSEAAEREVDVHVVVDRTSSNFEAIQDQLGSTCRMSMNGETVEAGEWPIMHIKAVVVDERKCFIGSWNFTHPGTTSNIEMGVLIENNALAHSINAFVEELSSRGLLDEV